MVKIKNIMKSFTRIVFFILYFGHNGQRHFWSKSLNVLISNGYKKGRQTSSQGLASHHLLIVKNNR